MGSFIKGSIFPPTKMQKTLVLSQGTNSVSKAKTVSLIGRIHAGIFNKGRLILNGLSVKLSFHRQVRLRYQLKDKRQAFKLNLMDVVVYLKKFNCSQNSWKYHSLK